MLEKFNSKNHRDVLACIFLALGLFGCANMSSLQTAKTLDKNTGRFLLGGGYYTSPELNEALDTLGAEDLKLPYMEFGYRRGITDKLELGAKLTLIGTMALDVKYQLVNEGDFAFSAGLSGGYFSMESGSGSAKNEIKTYEAIIPVHASYDLGDFLAVYVSPKYAFRVFGGDASGTQNLAGVTGGIKLGKGFGLFLESTFMKSLGSDFTAIQVNGALFF